ncbi:MAG: flagellin lysine-N-methylase [Clostridia bacterium]|nr:flagellin lysine-N-methylase [Clostridia bacterium]
MKETNEFLMPEYYLHFSCKMGACRSACCEGWPISVSMTNYFRLLGLDCEQSMRRRLDVGLRVVDHPTPECYARFNPRYDGNCPMRMEDGRCSIHASIGEDELPDICRLYPRGIRTDADKECSCANSCEAVLEMLAEYKEPMRFVRRTITVDVPDTGKRTTLFDTLGRGQKIRMTLVRFLQDRRHSLRERLACLYAVTEQIACALEEKNGDAIDAAAARAEAGETFPPQLMVSDRDSVLRSLDVLGEMAALLTERHDSIRDYGEAALAYYGEGDDRFLRWQKAQQHFRELFPDWEIWFEQMLVNHIFFTRFPFQERPVSLPDESNALCAVYAVLRYIGLAYMADKTEKSDFVDAAAACFRMIDHTDFEPYAAVLLKHYGVTSDAERKKLLSI